MLKSILSQIAFTALLFVIVLAGLTPDKDSTGHYVNPVAFWLDK